jgi:hypothetical protein
MPGELPVVGHLLLLQGHLTLRQRFVAPVDGGDLVPLLAQSIVDGCQRLPARNHAFDLTSW